MKNLILTIAVILSVSAKAQEVFIEKTVDEMSDKVYYLLNKDIVMANEEKTKGIRMEAFLKEQDGKVIVSMLSVTMVNIGTCCENNELIILFDDDTKIKLKSWNKFNCKGNAWFFLQDEDVQSLSTKKIKKVRVTNGSSFESFTADPKETDKEYYINVFKAVTEQIIRESKK